MANTDRYDRQKRINGWRQEALSSACVFVAGAGALGNELIKNLALLGIGRLLIVDFDLIELSNLSRTVLFRDEDIGRPKAQTAAEAAARLNPGVDVRYINGDLFYDVGLGFYRHSDLVVSGLDSLAARSQVGLGCSLAGAPFLDGGMWALGGEVRWFLPGEVPCFECTLSDEDRERAYERRSCTGFRSAKAGKFEQRMSTTISTAAILGGMLAQEAARYLCGWEATGGEAIVYNGLNLTMHQTSLARNPECPYHSAYQDVVELECGVSETTARDLLRQAERDLGKPAVLELGRDFVLGRVDETGRACPRCGMVRQVEIVSRLDGGEAYADRSLNNLGVPLGEVLAARVGKYLRMYEFTGDVKTFW